MEREGLTCTDTHTSVDAFARLRCCRFIFHMQQ